jgi:predicted NUDIX family NTP pyrophosphohydrolase
VVARKTSAGLLPYRFEDGELQVLLVHPGGPFWASKDDGAWSIPKGEYGEGEDAFEVAQREFEEETGFRASGDFLELGTARQKSGKVVRAWAFEGDYEATRIVSNTFEMEWPPRSGRMRVFPEVDRAAWFSVMQAQIKISKGQVELLRRLFDRLGLAVE